MTSTERDLPEDKLREIIEWLLTTAANSDNPHHFAPRLREAADALASIRAERDAAVEALKPFAEAAENLDDHARDDDHLWESAAAMSLSAGDLRAARAIAGEQL